MKLSIEQTVEITLLINNQINKKMSMHRLDLGAFTVETNYDYMGDLEVRVNGHKVSTDAADSVSARTISLIIEDIENFLSSKNL